MKKKFFILFLLFFLLFKTNINFSSEIKLIVTVDDEVVTNEDLIIATKIFKYMYNLQDSNDQTIEKVVLENLINNIIKEKELEKENVSISEQENIKYLNLILKNYQKTLGDFRIKFSNKNFENHLKKSIKTEMSWTKLIYKKFSNSIEINVDEILAKNKMIQKNSKEFDDLIVLEKQKKLQPMSETYFNEKKNKYLIKYR